MIPKIIVGAVMIVMLFLSISPLHCGTFYLAIRPLLQPIADQGYNLVPGVPLTGILSLIIIFYSITICILRKGYSFFIGNIIPLYLLVFIGIISLFNTLNYMVSISHVLKLSSSIALYCLLYNSITNHDDAKKVLYAVVIMSTVPMIYGYYEYYATGGGRISGLFREANAYGEFLSIAFCACLMIFFQSNNRSHKILLLCITGSMILSMLLSGNRGQWIALFLALLFAYFGYFKKIRVRWLIICGVLIAIFFSGMIIQRFEELHEQHSWGGDKNTLKTRISNWNEGLSLFWNHPFTGHGVGTSKVFYTKYFGHRSVPHNDYVRLLIETGILGLLFYLIFLLFVLINSLKFIFNKKYWFINYPMLVLVIYWIIHSSVQNMIFNVSIFQLFLAILAVVTKWNKHKSMNDSK